VFKKKKERWVGAGETREDLLEEVTWVGLDVSEAT
jgi:hypothetical protein